MDLNISQQDKKLSSRYKSEVPNEIIEEQTKKIPNLFFLGLWVPTILTLGLYNKIVKLEDELLRKPKWDAMH